MTHHTHWLDRPGNVRRLLWLLAAICAVLFLGDFVFDRHLVHPWGALPGFFSIFGFIACVALVLLARYLRKLVMRREDYYEGGDE